MEFEAGESIIPPEMNAVYDHDEHALPSVLHRQRAKEHGEWVGFNSRPYHWICENRMHVF